MEGFGVVPEICWSFFQEQMQLEDEEAMAQLLGSQLLQGDKKVRNLSSTMASILWPDSYDDIFAYSSSSFSSSFGNITASSSWYPFLKPYSGHESCYMPMNNASGEDPLISSYQFDELICSNEANIDDSLDQALEKKRKLQNDECNLNAVPALNFKKARSSPERLFCWID